MQEEIKINSVTVFVNPYAEIDEEEEEKANDEKNTEDGEKVSFSENLMLYTCNTCKFCS